MKYLFAHSDQNHNSRFLFFGGPESHDNNEAASSKPELTSTKQYIDDSNDISSSSLTHLPQVSYNKIIKDSLMQDNEFVKKIMESEETILNKEVGSITYQKQSNEKKHLHFTDPTSIYAEKIALSPSYNRNMNEHLNGIKIWLKSFPEFNSDEKVKKIISESKLHREAIIDEQARDLNSPSNDFIKSNVKDSLKEKGFSKKEVKEIFKKANRLKKNAENNALSNQMDMLALELSNNLEYNHDKFKNHLSDIGLNKEQINIVFDRAKYIINYAPEYDGTIDDLAISFSNHPEYGHDNFEHHLIQLGLNETHIKNIFERADIISKAAQKIRSNEKNRQK